MKKRSHIFLLFVFSLCINAQTNILQHLNSNFETGNLASWRFVEVSSNNPAKSAALISTDAHSGQYAAKVSWATNPSYPEIIGSSHVIPRYYFGSKDCLNEGADRLLAMGSKVIKIWYYNGAETPNIMYPWNSTWPTNIYSLVQGLSVPHFSTLFNKPFKTFVLNVASMVNPTNPYYWKDNITPAQLAQEEQEFYLFAKALLTNFQGSGKTFVLQHHEGDWHLRGHTDATIDPDPAAISRMIQWLNARQRGVTKARNELQVQNVKVYHAAEINLVVKSMQDGKPNMVNKVLPFTNLDLVSYSCYDACLNAAVGDNQLLFDALKFIKLNMPDNSFFGNNNVYIGEYGAPENQYSATQISAIMSNTVNAGVAEACPYIIYWQLYDNELVNPTTTLPVTNNSDVRGFWLIRPDGSQSPHYNYLYSLCN